MTEELTSKLVALRLKGGEENTIKMFTLADELEIVRAHAEFSGSGDSGDIDEIYFFDASNEETNIPDDLHNLVHEYLSEKASDIPTDWYNNDGGRGSATINFLTGDVVITVQYLEYVDGEGSNFNVFE